MNFNTLEDGDSFTVQLEQAGNRLDKVLADYFKNSGSRTYFQMLIEKGLVRLNGAPVKKRFKVEAGDEVDVFFAASPEIDLVPQDISLDVLFEDHDLVIVNKPAGMVVHPAPGNWNGTFVNALLYHCRYIPEFNSSLSSSRPGIIHRLDKDTSGVLVAAKSLKAQQLMIEMFASRQVYKEYWTICHGNPGTCQINAPIGRHPVQRKLMCVREDGKAALTLCETLQTTQELSLVKVILATGRTHQIRVHLKHKGCPILGDAVYGSKHVNARFPQITRQQLHAKKLRFIHPITKAEIDCEAPFPHDMAGFLRKHFKAEVG